MPNAPQKHKPIGQTIRRDGAHRRLYQLRAYRDRFAPQILIERPLCERCKRVQSEHVHHKRGLADHPEDLLDQEQVEALCESCHNAATARGE